MKTLLAFCLLALHTSFAVAQKTTIDWSEDFKLKKGSYDFEILFSDNSGIYLQESHMAMKSYFVIGATVRESGTLIKMDKNLSDVIYQVNYNKELKGKEFDEFFVLKDKLFLMARVYNKKERTLTLLAAEVDKSSGELKSDFVEITNWQKEEKSDNINYKVAANADSTSMIIVSTVSAKEKQQYEIREFSNKLKQVGKPILISNQFERNTFELEDVIHTKQRTTVLVGREYAYQEGKKRKAKFLDFQNYVVRFYDAIGKQVNEINTTVDGRWLNSTKVQQVSDEELVLAAFYSTQKKAKETNGLMVQRINALTGTVLSTQSKELDKGMIAEADDDDEPETKEEKAERKELKKSQDENEGFSKYLKFKSFIPAPDGGIIILAEEFHSYTYMSSSYSPGTNGMPGRTTTTTYRVWDYGDLFMSKMQVDGSLSWLSVLPKYQYTVRPVGSSSGIGISISNYFDNTPEPHYSSVGILPLNNALRIYFNDHRKNANITGPGKRVKRVYKYSSADLVELNLDLKTGKLTRNTLSENEDGLIPMPRMSTLIGKTLYIMGKVEKNLGKSKVGVARINAK